MTEEEEEEFLEFQEREEKLQESIAKKDVDAVGFWQSFCGRQCFVALFKLLKRSSSSCGLHRNHQMSQKFFFSFGPVSCWPLSKVQL